MTPGTSTRLGTAPALEATTTPGASPRLGAVPALDGLRAIAILAVFGLHVARPEFSGGFVGVDVFFTLSAFLITSLILDELNERDGSYSFRGFYQRRALRLGPALVMWVALLAIPAAILDGQGHIVLRSVAIVFTYTNDFLFRHLAGAFGQSWSLAIEEQFYLIWPLILVAMYRRTSLKAQRLVLVGAVPIALLAMIAGIAHYGENFNYFLPTGHLVPITLGCLAANFRRYGVPTPLARRMMRPKVSLALLGILVILVLGYRHFGNNAILIPTTCAAGTITAWLILHACLGGDGLAMRLLASPPARWLGQRSYGMYLYSLTLLGLIGGHVLPGQRVRVDGLVTLVVSLVLVDVSLRYVERPIRSLGRRRFARVAG